MNYLRVLQFVFKSFTEVSFLPLVLWFCDLVVLTITRLLFDRDMILFSPRFKKYRSPKKEVSSK